VVLPEGCTPNDPPDCPTLRGYVFNTTDSSTWALQNPECHTAQTAFFELPTWPEASLRNYSQDFCEFGFDTITLGWQGSDAPTLKNQLVAGFATKDFYLGSLGLTPRITNTTNFTTAAQGLLGTLRSQKIIPSASYGYTAGAYYKPKPIYGSLTLGGYDATRTGSENLTVTMSPEDQRGLLISIDSITSGSHSLLKSPILAIIDSTVPSIWLPTSVCKKIESAFGLVWDPASNLYPVNEDIHTNLTDSNSDITFRLSTGGGYSNTTIDIVLPYASLDLDISFPLGGNQTSRYFPLRRADSEEQYTLGRVFLQEAYLVVDYDRHSFTVSQALFPDSSIPANLVHILPPNERIIITQQPQGSSLTAGAIAGIDVAAVVVILVFIFFVYRRQRRIQRRRHSKPLHPDPDLTHAEILVDEKESNRRVSDEAYAVLERPQQPAYHL